MIAFITRRLMISVFVLLAATIIMYVMTALSGDPLADLRQQTGPNREDQMRVRSERMNLDVPIPIRYLQWLGALITGDLGVNRDGQDVGVILGNALAATLQLVVAATVLAMLIGITVGILSALRQYSGFDYSVTFAAFVAFSLPLFWLAVMLKQYVAIGFNTWLRDPVIDTTVIVVVAIAAGLLWGALTAGSTQARLISFTLGALVTATFLSFLSSTRWFADPGLGTVVIGLIAVASAVGICALFAGLQYRGPLYAALAAAGLGTALHTVLGGVLTDPTWPQLLGLLVLTVGVCVALGYGLGGLLRRQAITTAILTGLVTAGLIFLDALLSAFQAYSQRMRGRPIATIGSNTPNFRGDFWQLTLDSATHIMLPTMALILISMATYSRYSRASMLEVMNQDYVRTARAKGLPERTVIVKHAFRNGMIPITTLMAFDFAGVIGGAVVTESVFGWKGMGQMFRDGLEMVDPAPVMAFFVVTGGAIVVFNMIADIIYAYLDPRIRLS
ncbi:hypothetical protein GCM10022248_58080 [Nonomuraea soli]